MWVATDARGASASETSAVVLRRNLTSEDGVAEWRRHPAHGAGDSARAAALACALWIAPLALLACIAGVVPIA